MIFCEIPQNPDDFLPEPPTFAVEIRSKNDKGPKSLQRMAEKRQDYFAAGTKAVWDVDPDGPVVIRLYLNRDHAENWSFIFATTCYTA